MDMTGQERIAAPRAAVYAALNDPDVLRQCIPGCKALERTPDGGFEATVGLAVGPVKATFTGAVTLSDLDPPRGYTISGEGKGGPAGFAKGSAAVRLEEDGTATILHYAVHAEVGGKLAQLGGRMVDSTARKLAGEFFRRFGELMRPEPAAEPEPRPVEPAPLPTAPAVAAASAATSWMAHRGAILVGGAALIGFALLLLMR